MRQVKPRSRSVWAANRHELVAQIAASPSVLIEWSHKVRHESAQLGIRRLPNKFILGPVSLFIHCVLTLKR
jgi:hypothetical protein